MKTLIVGLGNPEKKYTKTRHNIGFRIIDALENEISDKNIILLKPDTFMNNSGKAVTEYLKYSNLTAQNLIVIHDDIDLPFGEIRTSKDSSSAGHKGVQSIINELGTQNFTRVRIGINSKLEAQNPKSETDTAEFVLKNFSKDEEKELPEIIKKALEEISTFLVSCF
ncbi:MAG TPA: aminoacyl-tRNA hydrolase [Candidatus Paceibacterota bacterium]|nr:aminoacyl-tRNA hydrolase [Candidatus Paceibacterota bacterium]